MNILLRYPGLSALLAGALTTLISGPVSLATPENVTRIDVDSAMSMYDAAMEQAAGCDVFIGCAAVADYRPADVPVHKIKKSADHMSLELVRNPDIIAAVAAQPERPFVVGFAAETRDVLEYARGKLTSKALDMIVANDVSNADAGFNSDSNAATLIWPEGQQEIALTSKDALAREIVETVAARLKAGGLNAGT